MNTRMPLPVQNAPGRRMNWQTSLQTLPEDEDKEDWTFDEGVEETEAAHLRHVLQCHSLGIPVQVRQSEARFTFLCHIMIKRESVWP